MSVDPRAILEAVIPHPSGETVALYDVSHLLPTQSGPVGRFPQPVLDMGERPRIAPDFPGGPLGDGD